MKKYEKIEIYWVDSMHGTGWTDSEHAENNLKKEDLDHQSCGYFFKDTGYSVVIIQSYGSVRKDGSRNVDSFMEIPKCAIKKVKKL